MSHGKMLFERSGYMQHGQGKDCGCMQGGGLGALHLWKVYNTIAKQEGQNEVTKSSQLGCRGNTCLCYLCTLDQWGDEDEEELQAGGTQPLPHARED